MNYNNRLSSTLANNIRLDSSKEYEAEKIAGGNIIWLVNRPAGVKIYVNSTPDRSGALVLNEANRGYKWEQLGNYGDLKLYDNFYLWTEGKNINGDLIELQVSPNADIITPILGNTADKIDKISEVESIGNNVIYDLYTSQKALYDTSRIKYLHFVNGSFEIDYDIGKNNSMIWLTKLCNLSNITFDNSKCYRLTLQGHIDTGGDSVEQEGTENQYSTSQSLHLDIINLNSVDFDSNFTLLEKTKYSQIDNVYQANSKNFILERKNNYFCFWGGKTFYIYKWDGNGGITSTRTAFTASPNANVDFVGYGFLFSQMKDLVISLKGGMKDFNRAYKYSFHFSLKIQIDIMDNMPGAPIIDSNPYINNNI